MKCPRCNADVAPLQRGCDSCGFSAVVLHPCLGNQWVRLERITDSAHCLRLEENRQTEVILDDFERCFPQVFFAVYLGVIPKELRPAEVGFWLLNQGAFNTHSLHKRNDFGVVLVIDPHTRTASITLGYSIEACFSSPDLAKILREMVAHLAAGRFGKAIETACLGCAKQLRKHGRSTRWTPDGTLNPGMDFEPLRGGHRPVSRVHASLSNDSQP